MTSEQPEDHCILARLGPKLSQAHIDLCTRGIRCKGQWTIKGWVSGCWWYNIIIIIMSYIYNYCHFFTSLLYAHEPIVCKRAYWEQLTNNWTLIKVDWIMCTLQHLTLIILCIRFVLLNNDKQTLPIIISVCHVTRRAVMCLSHVFWPLEWIWRGRFRSLVFFATWNRDWGREGSEGRSRKPQSHTKEQLTPFLIQKVTSQTHFWSLISKHRVNKQRVNMIAMQTNIQTKYFIRDQFRHSLEIHTQPRVVVM